MTLAEYLEAENISMADFAAKVNATAEAVRLWANGQRHPRRDAMKAIFEVTGGRVTANDFYGAA